MITGVLPTGRALEQKLAHVSLREMVEEHHEIVAFAIHYTELGQPNANVFLCSALPRVVLIRAHRISLGRLEYQHFLVGSDLFSRITMYLFPLGLCTFRFPTLI